MSGKAWAAIAVGTAIGSASCGGATDPKSEQAANISDLWWTLLAISCAVFVIVVGLLAYALLRRRRETSVFDRSPRSGFLFVAIGGGAIPLVILAAVFGYSLDVMRQSGSDTPDQLVVEVTGHQYRYDVAYPGQGANAENELHVPVGRQVKLVLKSDDVIHSFWVPQLNGKTDLIPGTTNSTYITATSPGTWTGRCAEFCGPGHTTMAITVTAEPTAQFDAWVASHRAAASRGK